MTETLEKKNIYIYNLRLINRWQNQDPEKLNDFLRSTGVQGATKEDFAQHWWNLHLAGTFLVSNLEHLFLMFLNLFFPAEEIMMFFSNEGFRKS